MRSSGKTGMPQLNYITKFITLKKHKKYLIMNTPTKKVNSKAFKFLFIVAFAFPLLFSLQAADVIEVTLDSGLNYPQNLHMPESEVHKQFVANNSNTNFTIVTLFNVSSNFPVDIDGYFKPNTNRIKLKLAQAGFNQIKSNAYQNLEVEIPAGNNKSFTFQFNKSNPLSNDFQFKDHNGNSVQFSEGIHYHGIVKGNHTSWAALSIFEDHIRCLFMDYEGIYVLSAINHLDEDYVIYNDKDLTIPYYLDLDCGVDELSNLDISGSQRMSHGVENLTKKKGQAGSEMVKIAIECDYKMYEHYGNNLQGVYNYVAATLNEAALLYINESINIQLSEIVAWNEQDYYDLDTVRKVLFEFGDRRKDDFNGDLLHLFTSEYRDIGGIAQLNGLNKCFTAYEGYEENYGPYAVSVVDYRSCAFGLFHYDVWTFCHEIGHNFGALHTHDEVWTLNGNPESALDNGGACLSANTACYDTEVTPDVLETTGGSIMSYFVANADYGASFYRGLGDQPGERIRQNIDWAFAAGCTDNQACNFNPQALSNDGTCIYTDNNDNTIFEDMPWLKNLIDIENCTRESVIVYQNTSTGAILVSVSNGRCVKSYTCAGFITGESISNQMQPIRTWSCKDCAGNIVGCTNSNACNYNPGATQNDGSCYFANTSCNNNPCDENCTCTKIEDVEGTSQDVFQTYPWLAASINYQGDCNFEKITVYETGFYDYIEVAFPNEASELYLSNGSLYCSQEFCFDCIENYTEDATGTTCYTCENPTPPCNETGIVFYKYCSFDDPYYLIETTSGEILDPYNAAGINYTYPEGAVVNFSYNYRGLSGCPYADKAVNINCIEEVDLPCTNTGTVFYQTCNNESYYLIDMGNGQILDPYNSTTIDFEYPDGAEVEFAYMPLTNIFCNASTIAGKITCITSNTCDKTGIVYYENCGNQSYYFIQTPDGTIIDPYNNPGVNFNYPDGATVKFNYSSYNNNFCNSVANVGMNISCIEEITLPCDKTGTVIKEYCVNPQTNTNVIYYLIDMGQDGILDPYNSSVIDFNYVEGDHVQFAYMPFNFTPCTSARSSGIVTCIQSVCNNQIQKLNQIPIASGVYDGARQIKADGEVHGNSNVTFKAPDRIRLDVLFKVKAGATFKAVNEGCD